MTDAPPVTYVTPRNAQEFADYSEQLLRTPDWHLLHLPYIGNQSFDDWLRLAWEAGQARLAGITDPPDTDPPAGKPEAQR